MANIQQGLLKSRLTIPSVNSLQDKARAGVYNGSLQDINNQYLSLRLKNRNMKSLLLTLLLFVVAKSVIAQHKVVWEIGKADNSCADMALAPTGYNHFLNNDFGWEDK